jgi:hypothetical protein
VISGIEPATLEYLNAMPVPVAPRLLGADTELGILLMDDLGPGPTLADSLLTGQSDQAGDDLGVAAGLGLATDGVEDEISGLGALMSGSGLGGSELGGSGLSESGYLGLGPGRAGRRLG